MWLRWTLTEHHLRPRVERFVTSRPALGGWYAMVVQVGVTSEFGKYCTPAAPHSQLFALLIYDIIALLLQQTCA